MFAKVCNFLRILNMNAILNINFHNINVIIEISYKNSEKIQLYLPFLIKFTS